MDPAEVQRGLGLVAVILKEECLQERVDAFCDVHCDTFDTAEENKLSYMPIFQEFQGLVERYMESRLMEEGVNVGALMRHLPGFLQQPQNNQLPGDVVELLSAAAYCDFFAFKGLMLERQKWRAVMEAQAMKNERFKGTLLVFVDFFDQLGFTLFYLQCRKAKLDSLMFQAIGPVLVFGWITSLFGAACILYRAYCDRGGNSEVIRRTCRYYELYSLAVDVIGQLALTAWVDTFFSHVLTKQIKIIQYFSTLADGLVKLSLLFCG